MREYAKKLINKMVNEGTEKYKVGNHKAFREGDKIFFMYYSTVICEVNLKKGTFFVDSKGYETISTLQALDSYKEGLNTYFDNINHKEMTLNQKNLLEITGVKVPTKSSCEEISKLLKGKSLLCCIHNNEFHNEFSNNITKIRFYDKDIYMKI